MRTAVVVSSGEMCEEATATTVLLEMLLMVLPIPDENGLDDGRSSVLAMANTNQTIPVGYVGNRVTGLVIVP